MNMFSAKFMIATITLIARIEAKANIRIRTKILVSNIFSNIGILSCV